MQVYVDHDASETAFLLQHYVQVAWWLTGNNIFGLYRAVIELNGLCAANYAVTVTWHRTYQKCSDKIHGRPSSFTPTFIKRNCATTQLLVLYIHALPVLTLPS